MKESSYLTSEYDDPSVREKEGQEMEWDHDFDLNSLLENGNAHSVLNPSDESSIPSSLSMKIKELEDEVNRGFDEYQKELKKVKDDNESLKAELKKAKDENAAVSSAKDQLEAELKKAKDENAALKSSPFKKMLNWIRETFSNLFSRKPIEKDLPEKVKSPLTNSLQALDGNSKTVALNPGNQPVLDILTKTHLKSSDKKARAIG